MVRGAVMSGHTPFERRAPPLFALLALCVLGLLAVSGWSHGELQQAQKARDRSGEMLARLAEFERAIAPQPALLLCAAQGASPVPVPRPPDPRQALVRLRAATDDARARALFEELPLLVDALQRRYTTPLDAACREQRRLTYVGALEIASIGVVHRSRMEALLAEARGIEQARFAESQMRWQTRSETTSRFFMLCAVASGVLAVFATLGIRGVTRRLAEANRRLRREATDRGVAQEQQREAQRRLDMVLDQIPDAVMSFDVAARVQWMNPAGATMFGRSAASVRSQPMALLVPELDHWLHWPDTRPEADPDEPRPESWSVRREVFYGLRADGREFPIEVALVQTRVNGERLGLCVCRDLSEQAQVDRMKHDVVSMVSRELHAPLTHLQASLATLAGTAGEPGAPGTPARHLAGQAHEQSLHLVALVSDILDFEKLQAGELRIEPRALDLCAAARATVEACTAQAQAHRVTVRLEAGQAPVPVQADPQHLARVLVSLLSNAILRSPEGGEVRLLVATSGGEGRVRVIDQGPGVPPGDVGRLFEPFTPSDEAGADRQGRAGLALAISRGMIEQMGGRIGIDAPQPGHGAVFWIALPRCTGEDISREQA